MPHDLLDYVRSGTFEMVCLVSCSHHVFTGSSQRDRRSTSLAIRLFQGQLRKSMPPIFMANTKHRRPQRRCIVPLVVWLPFRSFPKMLIVTWSMGPSSLGALREVQEPLAGRRCGSDGPHRRSEELGIGHVTVAHGLAHLPRG